MQDFSSLFMLIVKETNHWIYVIKIDGIGKKQIHTHRLQQI